MLRLLLPGAFLDKTAFNAALEAYSLFIARQTNKHRSRVTLSIIEDADQLDTLSDRVKVLGLSDVVQLFNRDHTTAVKTCYRNSNLFVYLGSYNQKRIIIEALKYDLPFISMENGSLEALLDCNMGLYVSSDKNLARACSALLEMLYYDREVLKILRKGAMKKRKSIFYTIQR